MRRGSRRRSSPPRESRARRRASRASRASRTSRTSRAASDSHALRRRSHSTAAVSSVQPFG
ncbi:hypothetical protein DIJ61_08215 [Burkholderia pseudomallei]|nr:hypothetical protein DIJ61_08215 [Burkholderia pseudomallei]